MASESPSLIKANVALMTRTEMIGASTTAIKERGDTTATTTCLILVVGTYPEAG